MTAADVIQQTQHKMGVTVEKLRDDFTRIQYGPRKHGSAQTRFASTTAARRPSIRLLQVGVGDAHTLTVQPWEKEHGEGLRKKRFAIRTWVLTRPLGRHDSRAAASAYRGTPPRTHQSSEGVRRRSQRWQCAICAVTPIRSSNVWRRIRKSLKTISVAMKPKSRSSRIALWLKSTR